MVKLTLSGHIIQSIDGCLQNPDFWTSPSNQALLPPHTGPGTFLLHLTLVLLLQVISKREMSGKAGKWAPSQRKIVLNFGRLFFFAKNSTSERLLKAKVFCFVLFYNLSYQ